MTPEQQQDLYKETDARFWLQSGYRPGHKLDPNGWIDRAFVPVWQDAYRKVLAEWKAGKLVKTHDHPMVQSLVAKAATLFHKAEAYVANALAAPTLDEKNAHAAVAADAHAQANQATTHGATYQPPTISPQLAAEAAQQVYAQVAAPPAAVVVTTPDGVPVPPPPSQLSVRDALDALQAAHAPGKAAATETQTPAADAPKKASTATTLLVIAGGFGLIGIAAAIQHPTAAEAARELNRRRKAAR